jgi:hypothetical protein
MKSARQAKNRIASLDTIFEAFDDKIETFLGKYGDDIAREYRSKVKRPISDTEVDTFIGGLGDRLYAIIQPDPSSLQRFVNFYADDVKLQKAVSDIIENSSFPTAPIASTSPSSLASTLRQIADRIDASKKPSQSLVASELKRIVAVIED